MDYQEVNTRIAELLAAQFADAKRRMNNSYWGNTGYDVQSAAGRAESAIGDMQPGEEVGPFLAAALERVRESKSQFAEYNDDDDGFGAATFHEILRDLADVGTRRPASPPAAIGPAVEGPTIDAPSARPELPAVVKPLFELEHLVDEADKAS